MKRLHNKLIPILLILSLCFSLAACGGKATTSKSTVLVLGAHENFPKVPLTSENIYNEIYETAYANGHFSVIVADGTPFMYADYSIEDTDKAINQAKRKQIAKQNTAQIILDAQSAYAKTAEFDTLSAITKATGQLQSSNASDKTLIVCDSGFSTSGYLNFASSNLINADPDELISKLSERHAIPDLTDIKIIWFGMGQVDGDQTTLSPDYIYKLKAIWSALLAEGNASSIDIDTADIGSLSSEYQLPPVSTIPIISDELDVDVTDISQPIKLTTVKFVSDTAEYIDESVAVESLTPVAEYIKTHPDVIVAVVGSTASVGSDDECISLSKSRAERCRESLMQLGADGSRITCIGVGRQECSLRVNDLDESGNLVESYASLNRAIFIVDANSEYLQGIN